jgi:predicted alpha/beta-hydrolase family hydrolase
VEVPWADHSFAVPKRAATTQEDALRTVADGVAEWLGGLRADRE